MIVDKDRIVPEDEGGVVPTLRVYAKKDNEPIFRGKADVWPLIKDLPARCYFDEVGEVGEEPAELVRLFESGVFFPKGDLRRELTPLIVQPEGYRRILKVAWAMSEQVAHVPIPLAKAGVIMKQRFPRLTAPGAPGQWLAFARSFREYPCDALRFVLVTWESRRGLTLLK